jgi:hypothetical protein
MRTIETFLQMCGTEKFSSASSSGSSSHGAASSYSTMSIEKIMETLDTLYHQH